MSKELFEVDELIFQRGDRSEVAYVIESGQVEIFDGDLEEPKRVALLEAGDIFGEMSLVDELPRSHSARALDNVIARRLSQSDFVSLHTSLNQDTYHLINEAALSKMKPSAFLINTSRGPVVDEQALVDALHSKSIAGAGLDVFEDEPKIHPDLLSMESVVLAPHIGSGTHSTRRRMAEMVAKNVLSVLHGKEPQNPVFSL